MNAADTPRKGDWFGRRVWVCFDCDYASAQLGTIIDDDPLTTTVIELDTGRVVLGTQCLWRPVD